MLLTNTVSLYHSLVGISRNATYFTTPQQFECQLLNFITEPLTCYLYLVVPSSYQQSPFLQILSQATPSLSVTVCKTTAILLVHGYIPIAPSPLNFLLLILLKRNSCLIKVVFVKITITKHTDAATVYDTLMLFLQGCISQFQLVFALIIKVRQLANIQMKYHKKLAFHGFLQHLYIMERLTTFTENRIFKIFFTCSTRLSMVQPILWQRVNLRPCKVKVLFLVPTRTYIKPPVPTFDIEILTG